MSRQKLSTEKRKLLLKQLDKKNESEQRKRRLYNRIYRKSFLFIGAWAIRILYFILFIVVAIFNQRSKGYSTEILLNESIEAYADTSAKDPDKKTILYVKTNHDSYNANITGAKLPALKINDTVLIERNIFRKPIYFTRRNWNWKYEIEINYQPYYIILFLTFITFFFNDGLDPFTNKILWASYAIDIIAIGAYFFT